MEVGQVIAGRYELDELAETGDTASVYRATDRLLERPVAIEVLHERYARDGDYVERFRGEARAIAQLSHPNVVAVINLGESGGHPFIVFEYVAGETLRELIRREGRLNVRSALVITRELARGLAFANEHGVHRDVKPDNVIVDPEGTPKIAHFGNARSQEGPVGEHSGQHSLGILLYELLTGQAPDPDPTSSVRKVRADVPPEVDELIRRATQKDHEGRFESTAELVVALDGCLARYEEDTLSDLHGADLATQVAAPPVREEGRAARQVRRARRGRRPLLLLAVVLAAAALATLALLLVRDGGDLSLGVDGGGGGGEVSPQLRAVADHDPAGDDTEHPEAIAATTDGNVATYWTTETYFSGFAKPGVGVVLKASGPVNGGTLVVRSDEGGFTAEVQASNRRSRGFQTVSEAQTVGSRTEFELDTGGEEYRFLLIWITDLGEASRAHVNEVSLRPEAA